MKFFSSSRVFLACLFCAVIVSCSENTKPIRTNDIYKIVFAQGGCYGTCPAESFSIDSSLRIKYRGVQYVDRIGYFQGNVSSLDWDTIQSMCRKCTTLQTDSCWGIDLQMTELHIYGKHGVQHFWGNERCLPEPVVALCYYLDTLDNNTLMTESYEFPLETHAHIPPHVMNPSAIRFTEPE